MTDFHWTSHRSKKQITNLKISIRIHRIQKIRSLKNIQVEIVQETKMKTTIIIQADFETLNMKTIRKNQDTMTKTITTRAGRPMI